MCDHLLKRSAIDVLEKEDNDLCKIIRRIRKNKINKEILPHPLCAHQRPEQMPLPLLLVFAVSVRSVEIQAMRFITKSPSVCSSLNFH